MRMRKSRFGIVLAIVLAGLVMLGGCEEGMPHSFVWPDTGEIRPSHAKPIGADYDDWDPFSVTLEVEPGEDVNPVGTQHIFIASIKDKDGKLLPNRRVEWIIPDGGVGAIVEVDEFGWRASRGNKFDNRFAVSHTSREDHVITRGNDDPSDDIPIKRGQTWAVITSPVEGTTNMIAYAPGIQNWDKHKVFVKKHWYDVVWEFPPDATNPIGKEHTLRTRVSRYSDKTPLADYEVTYKIISGPAATLGSNRASTTTVKTDANGLAIVALNQSRPLEGVNAVQIDVVRPKNVSSFKDAVHMATGVVRKRWIGPKIAISKTAPAKALVGEKFSYSITVSNPSKVTAKNVSLTDILPGGITYVSSTPRANVRGSNLSWSLGSLAGGARKSVKVEVQATRTGKFINPARVIAAGDLAARATAETIVAQANLTLTKQSPGEVLICDPIEYVLVVENTGDAAATNVKLTDKLPAGLTYKDKYSTITSNIGTLAPGQSKRVRYTVKATKTGIFTNKANVSADGGLTAEAFSRTEVKQPVLVVTKMGPARRYIGRTIAYEITVANRGDGVAKNAIVTDVIPAGTTFAMARNGVVLSGGKVTWRLGDILPNGSKQVTLELTATRSGTVRNVTKVIAHCVEASGEAVTVVTGIPAILLECVDTDDPIEVGATETYIITVTNQGTADSTNVVITCTLPPEQQFLSAQSPAGHIVDGQVVTFKPVVALAPKKVATYRLHVKGIRPGDVRFRVALKSDQMVTPSEETESTNIYE